MDYDNSYTKTLSSFAYFDRLYTVYLGSRQPTSDSIACTIITTNDVISAQCSNSDSTVTGFQMIVQNANLTDLAHVGRLVINRTNDISSPMSLQVEVRGEHLITIFSIRRGRGIVNAQMPYQTRMMVNVPVTTSSICK